MLDGAKSFIEQERSKVSVSVLVPANLDEVQSIIDRIKAHEIAVINYETLPDGLAHSVHNSLLGALYALGGTLKQASENVFIYYI